MADRKRFEGRVALAEERESAEQLPAVFSVKVLK